MISFLIFVHAISCVLLIILVLMQSGRGGGLTEGFASAESMFGAKTNEFMVKATALFTTLFFITSLSLAYLSSKKERSLMSDVPVAEQTVEKTGVETEDALAVPEAEEKVDK